MSRYFMLECFPPMDWEDSALVMRSPSPPGVESWTIGRKFPDGIPVPLEFSLMATHSDEMLEMNNTEALLITKRLLAALLGAGVDNLDTYAAVIRHPETGRLYENYVAVNVIGLISAADLAKSKVVGGSPGNLIDVDFDSVSIDDARAGGALLFRLAENTSAIVVHERVKQHLLSEGFDMLTFVEPSEWMG